MGQIKTRCSTAAGLFLILLTVIAGFSSCKSNQKDIIPSAEYAPYVNAYTGGVISQNSTIRIELTQDQPMVDLNQELKDNPFSFSPSLKGKTYWVSNNTIEFVPEEGALKPGAFYEGTFHLGDFVDVDKKLEEFNFSFRVQERNFSIHTDPITVTATQPDQVTVTGEIRFSDVVKKEEVEKMLTAGSEKNKSYPIEITQTDHPTRYAFSISQITREAEDYQLEITAKGNPAGIDRTQNESILIPAKNSFRFLSAVRIDQPENGIEIIFSDPVSNTQDLKGLIDVPEVSSSIFQIKENKVFVYFETGKLNKLTLNIHEGIRNSQDKPLGTSHSISFSELNLKPQVEMATSAAILPDSKSLIIPFRAVNLYAVDLSVIRIFENNVLMFMQNNSLSSANELRRSGRLVYKKTLWLAKDSSKDVHRWEDYSIDLAGLIHQEPGAIYRVILSFRQEYSAYPCGGSENKEMQFADNKSSDNLTKVSGETLSEDDEAVWDTPETYYYYNGSVPMDWSQYRWTERDNPCHSSYYMNSDRIAACNIFASNLGMIVKRNSLNKLWIAVNNILDTKPVAKAQVTIYNFQLQPIGKGETNGEGLVEITPKGVPFIAVAEADKQKAYVRVVDGEEQSVSRFDVGGKDIQKGLKGFIYGERGVWRPGDTLHISFMLEDREKRIPDKHPVALEIYNPRGQFYTKMISTQGTNGFYTFAVPTQADDPTGLWNAYVKVGGTAFHKSLRIETIKPNRLKITLALPTILQASSKDVYAPLTSSWLTGATASRLKAKVEMSLSKVNTQFKNYGQYLFNNPATDFTTVRADVFNGVLDAEGRAGVNIQLPVATGAPGMLNATFTTRVFEPGGDASIYSQTVPFSPFTSYVGINLNQPKGKYIETDKDHVFDIVTVNDQGQPVNRSNLEYKIYRISWSWWWENGEESFGTYINNSSITPVASGNLQTTGGKTSFKFRINYPDWGRYLVYVKDRESGHATGGTVYIDWPDWRGRSNKTDPSGIKMLAFSLDKDSYEIGETATAIIPAAAGGRALVSLENGSTVLQQQWLEVSDQGDTKLTFKITPEMAPNVYLHISLLQPHAQTVNDLPIRMYGIAPVFVTNRQTILQPQIKMPEVLRPETDFNVTVSEKSGKPMTYTLAIVDDGLLDLTNFKTPDPWNEFYAREALGIRTWDMYDDVLGASSGRYSSLFSTGGDASLKPADAKANRFKPVVKFIGPFYLAKGKQQTHTLKLPMYVGSVRAMVVAGQDGAYGNAEKTAFVRTPLMLLSTLPRVLSTQEEITVPVNVFAMENQVKNVTVSLEASGAGVQITGNRQQSLTFDQPGDQLAYFTLKTGSKTGKATIHLTASGNGQQTKETIEIEVRNPNPVVTLRNSQWIEAGQEAELSYTLAGSSSANNQVQLEVSRIPSVDISRRFDFLYNYQHHCTEQLTSKALPLLFVSQFKAVDEQEAEKIKTNVQEAIRQIYARQLPYGGFVYWPGNAVADEWITSYTGMFLTLAQEKGYAVHPNVLNKWKRFQRAAAQNWRMPQEASNWQIWQSELQQAFRLYTLALAGAPEYGAMNRMKEQPGLSIQAKWRLAAAYALTGKMKPAGELVYNAETTVIPYSSMNLIYGSSDRDEAMILETLILMKRDRDALQQAKKVSQNLAQENWFSTQSTAFALMAMGRLAEQLSGTLDFTWSWNGKQQPAVKSAKAVFEKEIATSPKSGTVSVKNKGKGALSVDLITRTQLLNDTLPAIADNIRLDVKYTDMAGSPISVEDIRQGTDFMSAVTLSNISGTSDYSNLALTHIIPSGWEIYNERMIVPEASSSNSNEANTPESSAGKYTYKDIRDDRVLTYFDLRRGESKTFTVRLQATYAGNFILPAIQCEAMYDAAVQARTKAGRTTVSR
ncbi:alpha-2-macroglobulin family protein [Bacteroides thetaiotaomicron]|uniref:alpha-2-macroglobulin family protein n=1 Tax=Bacteroides thetaiotaomicron TaxID=818 RepID=UPI0026E4568D|nr:MG2 domain-containing protein [Bacteroides thetaiotaomicron]MDO6185323.1 MG2 domain-containing protein [Bacteroides thetaiotaomicron]MDO6202003.1 MG2 domain-containing protein [Bacteroides thetaiotaomicron]MDO6206865.1 MG2 domain-containing protein [Bacteroides thetaiotaomicron]MDO6212214.1 MG2 domain-containing protein [Bacteroides thetaiotaomicron]MDO6220188.1 MG2 domain-containing protein [Bacteroides thetaiotaomicron]